MNLSGKRIMLIGGAGLVGSHIVDQLTAEPVAEIVVFDNFVRGTRDNLAEVRKSPKVRIVNGSMTDRDALKRELAGIDGVFQLASLWLGECVNDPRSAWEVNTLRDVERRRSLPCRLASSGSSIPRLPRSTATRS